MERTFTLKHLEDVQVLEVNGSSHGELTEEEKQRMI